MRHVAVERVGDDRLLVKITRRGERVFSVSVAEAGGLIGLLLDQAPDLADDALRTVLDVIEGER